MIGENIKYYRQLAGMTQEELAVAVGMTKMAVSNYETEKREADSSVLIKIAKALNVRPSRLMNNPTAGIAIEHGAFRKGAMTSVAQEIFFRQVDDYLGRFTNVLRILGERVLPDIPMFEKIHHAGDIDATAHSVRIALGLAENGPIGNLVDIVENRGYIVCNLQVKNKKFFGNHGLVNGRPYIAINSENPSERQRFTIAHELIHLLVDTDDEKVTDAIAGAMLFTKTDVLRELGAKRTNIWSELRGIQREYGISLQTVLIRAKQCGVLTKEAYETHQKRISAAGLRQDEHSNLQVEKTTLFRQLVVRAVAEGLIGIGKATELLDMPRVETEKLCDEVL